MLGVDAAVVGDVLLAPLVHVHAAHLALQALLDQAVEQRSAVVAEREPLVVVHHEPMWYVDVEPLSRLLRWLLTRVLLEEKTGTINTLVRLMIRNLTSSPRIPGHFVRTRRWHRLCTTHVQTERTEEGISKLFGH